MSSLEFYDLTHPWGHGMPEWPSVADIPTIENVGGDVDLLLGKRVTIQSFPWRWPEGDACPVRLVALRDNRGDYRIETGEAK